MATKTINTKILLRTDIESNWNSANPVLSAGEIAISSDKRKIKIGDGKSDWKTLSYATVTPEEAGETYGVATETTNGLMSSADFKKLAGIEAGANVNVIESVKVNGIAVGVGGDKSVDIVVPKGALASKDKIEETDFGSVLAGVFDALEAAKHTHTNKTVLDGLSSTDVDKWNSKQDPATTLAGYGISDAYTKSEVDGKLVSVFKWGGVLQTYQELAGISSPTSGLVYHVVKDATGKTVNQEYAYNGDLKAWEPLGGIVDLSQYATKTDLEAKVDKEAGKSLMTDAERTKLSGVADNATKVENSLTNGNIKINGTETQVYVLPDKVVTSDDTLVFNCGGANQ